MRALRALLLFLLCTSIAVSAELRTVKGELLKGDLVSVSDKEVVLSVGGKETPVPLVGILAIELGAPGKLPTENRIIDVELTDGSVIHCSTFKVKANQASFTVLLTGQEVMVPLSGIANVLNDAQVEKNRKDWDDRITKKRRRDVVVRLKDSVPNPVEGTLGEGDETGGKIEFAPVIDNKALDKRLVPLDDPLLRGLIFQRAPNPLAAPVVFKLHDNQGNQVRVASATTDGTNLTVTTPVGAKLTFPFAQLARLDYNSDKLRYLSDMKPLRQVTESASGERFVHLIKDKNLNGGELRLKGVVYPKGLAMFTYTELEYNLGGDYEQFRAMVGFDDEVKGADGPIQLRIEGDGAELLSLTLSREDKLKSQPISLNVKDVNKLRIVVSDPSKTDIGKHLDLADAKISK
jgi:hypothetical protein